jgi:SRSO17 transposase
MTRDQKIEALAEEYVAMAYGNSNDKAMAKLSYHYGILAGIALRDAELLAELFKTDSVQMLRGYFGTTNVSAPEACDYFKEQMLKAIKGE